MGIDTYQEPVVYMRADCSVCRSEGFESHSRVCISGNGKSLIATLNIVIGELLNPGEAGLSDTAWELLGADKVCPVTLSHPEPVESFRHVRSKLFGHSLSPAEFDEIIHDVSKSRYSDIQLSAFLSGCVGSRLNSEEVLALTDAMVATGDKLDWRQSLIFDKHCVGGLPGNRTTPIVVSIVTACGFIMPKTSSRAITSPAGTADTMETLTRVDLSVVNIHRVVEQEGGCLVWGGSVDLSPADDVLIRVERALDIDSKAQLVASVLSKKIAAGSTHVIIDVPTGPTAKVRDQAAADSLSTLFQYVGAKLGIVVEVAITDGTQPIGQGIGPALEARDVLSVLKNEPNAPKDLRARAAFLAGRILELGKYSPPGQGIRQALSVLDRGHAWQKFQAICEAQGGLKSPQVAEYRHEIVADKSGQVNAIDNRRLAMVAKLAGAPKAAAAGVDLHVKLGDIVESGTTVLTVHAEAPGELAYALGYITKNAALISIDGADKTSAG
jgi:thymidine phosphorylase